MIAVDSLGSEAETDLDIPLHRALTSDYGMAASRSAAATLDPP